MQRLRVVWKTVGSEVSKLSPKSTWGFPSCDRHTDSLPVSEFNERSQESSCQVTKRHKRVVCQEVLDCYDKQYNQELGSLWASARAVLLDPPSWQYGVMLNRFSAVSDVTQILHSEGFSTLQPQTEVSALTRDDSSKVPDSQPKAVKGSFSSSPIDFPVQPDGNSGGPADEAPTQPSLLFPRSSLQCYIHPQPVRFPSQPHRPGQLKQYYLLNAASLLPVLALHVRDGERVLDLCSAPGGKALAIMQCATPDHLCCNEPDPHRRQWLAKTLESFLPHSLHRRVAVFGQDGRSVGNLQTEKYDKVLVDAPCSNDRSWLYSRSSQQGEKRLQERVDLPELQLQLLRSALSAVRPGGVVVYSTCTLSSSENYSVVETLLKETPEAEAEDLWEELAVPLSKYFAFNPAGAGHDAQTLNKPSLQPRHCRVSSYHHRLGILVVPQPGRTWGPMFLSRIRRTR